MADSDENDTNDTIMRLDDARVLKKEAEAGNVPTFKLGDIPLWLDDKLCG